MSEIFTLEKLYLAYNECKKGKKNTHNTLSFEMDREKNLLSLLHDLQTKTYRISRHVYFITTYPTAREIFAADFRDRIVHHLLYSEIYKIFDSDFIPDSYANRIGKGTHAAVKKLQKNMLEVKRVSGSGYYLKLDVQSFFRSINKDILYGILEEKIKKVAAGGGQYSMWASDVLWITKIIVFHNPTKNFVYRGDPTLKNLIPKSKSLFYSGDLGLPIGNLTSQFFANIYLNTLDHFIAEELGFKHYVRYVDDFVIVDISHHKLRSSVAIIDSFLQVRLGLKLHPRKIRLQETRKGVDFLGYFVKPSHILVRQSVVKRFKDKLCKHRDNEDGLFKVEDISMIKSYLGHFSHANTYNLRKKLES
ncbi:MAG: reverse transcriptase/maturase family protein [bacterium]